MNIMITFMFLNSLSLPLLLFLSSFWGFIFAVKRYTKLKTGFIPLFVFGSLSVVAYLSCFLSIFKQINFSIMLIGNILFLREIYLVIKDLFGKKLNLKSYLTAQKTLIFFVFSSVALFFYINNASLYGWDEFFWGQFTKYIHEYGHFWHLGDAILSSHSVYPPMVAISQNLLMPFGSFNEETMFFANLLPIVFVFTYVFDSFTQEGVKNNFLRLIAIFILIYWAYFYFCFSNVSVSYFWSFAGVDHAMAMIFTTILLFSYENKKSKKTIFFLLPVLFFLTLYKTTGILLAISSIVIFLFPEFINVIKERKIKSFKRVLFLTLFFFIAICLAYFSWGKYAQVTQLVSNRAAQREIFSLSQSQLWNTFYSQVLNNFFEALANRSLNYGVGIGKEIPQLTSLVFWVVFVLVLQVVAIFFKNDFKKQEFIFLFLLLDTCFILWILFHLYVWLFVFSEYEGLALASYERYLNTFLAAIFMFTVFLLAKNTRKKQFLAFLIMLSIFLNLSFSINKKNIFLGPDFFIDRNRFIQTSLALKVQSKIKIGKAKVWYINQNSNGYEAMIFRYEMSPRYYVQSWNWSLGKKYYPEDVWTTNLSVTEFQDLLLGKGDNPNIPYDYIVLDKIDENFQEQYGSFFSEETSNSTLWQLRQDNGLLKAIKIIF